METRLVGPAQTNAKTAREAGTKLNKAQQDVFFVNLARLRSLKVGQTVPTVP